MEKYEAPKLEVIEMQNDVILCCTGDYCPVECPEEGNFGGGGCPEHME